MIAYLETGAGYPLLLRPGRRLVARVVRAGAGRATVSVAGVVLDVAATMALRPGETVRLVVGDVAEGRIALRLEATDAPTPSAPGLDLLG